MNIGIDIEKHSYVFHSNMIPSGFEKYKVPGSTIYSLEGDFGALINQSIPADNWHISLHYFFFKTYTWLRYPGSRDCPVIIFNCGKNDLKIHNYVSPDQRVWLSCNGGPLKEDDCAILDCDYYLFPVACEKGNYQFFTVTGGPHQIESIVYNDVLREIAIPELLDTLRDIGHKINVI
jgi:hypothetical protein